MKVMATTPVSYYQNHQRNTAGKPQTFGLLWRNGDLQDAYMENIFLKALKKQADTLNLIDKELGIYKGKLLTEVKNIWKTSDSNPGNMTLKIAKDGDNDPYMDISYESFMDKLFKKDMSKDQAKIFDEIYTTLKTKPLVSQN